LNVCSVFTRLLSREDFIIFCSREAYKEESDSKSCSIKCFYVSGVEPSRI
jgi:hypothetical protein